MESITKQAIVIQVDENYLEKRCRERFIELNLNTVEDMKAYIKSLFENFEHQSDVLGGLYKLVLT